MRFIAIMLSLLFVTTAAHASSDATWDEFTLAVTKSCAAASGFDDAKASAPISFDDTLNKVASLVTGTHPQPFMKGAEGTVLCVYDKLTQQTWIDEAAGWTAPDLR